MPSAGRAFLQIDIGSRPPSAPRRAPRSSGGRDEASPQTLSAARRRRRCAPGSPTHRPRAGCGKYLAGASGALDRVVRGRRLQRHHRARHRAVPVGLFRAAVLRREPYGRRRQCRHGGGAARDARRLHDRVRHAEQCDRGHAVRKAAVQFHPRQRADRRHHAADERPGGQPQRPGPEPHRIHRLRESQSGQDQLRVGRRRHVAAPLRRAVQGDDRHQHAARALPRRRAGDRRRARRPGAGRCSTTFRARSATSNPESCARWA